MPSLSSEEAAPDARAGANAAELLEREVHLELAARLIDRVGAGEGSGMCLEGPAGIGKTSVLGAVCSMARRRGLHVLAARGDELERDLPFGVVRDLLRPAAREADEVLVSGAAALALPVLGLGAAPPVTDPTAAALHGLHSLCAALAERAPLLLAIDDAHWADEASLRFIAYLARRLDDMPVLVLVALRPHEPRAPQQLLEAVLGAPGVLRERLTPLSVEATAVLVRQRVAAAADDDLIAVCQEVTGGNPFLLGELLRTLVAEGIDPLRGSSAAVREIGPEAVARSALIRLARLSPEAAELARAVAIFPDGAALRHVAALAELDEAEAAAAADALADGGILRAERPLAFVHPLVRNAIYRELRPGARALAHARAAAVLAAEGAAPETVASHLLHTEPSNDAEVVATLRSAAAGALVAGAPAAAVRYLRRALEEPPDPMQKPHVLHELGVAALTAGDEEAMSWLAEATALWPLTDPLGAAVWLEYGRALGMVGQVREAVEAIEQAIAAIREHDEDQARLYEAELLWIAWQDAELKAICHERVGRLGELPGDSLGEQLLLCYQANLAAEQCEPHERVVALAERALAGGRLADGGLATAPTASFAIAALISADRLDAAWHANERSLGAMRREGAAVGLPMAHATAANIARLQGRLVDAETEAALALELVEQQAAGHLGSEYARAELADIYLAQGRVDAAVAICPMGEPKIWTGFTAALIGARGRVRLARGDAAGARDDFSAVARFCERQGVRNPTESGAWRAGMALALARLGDKDRAGALVDEEVNAARAFGAARPLGEALHAAGLVHDGGQGRALLREAVDVLAGSPARLSYARALVDLGAALRRDNQRSAARDPLRRGLDLSHACGAAGLAAFAETELRATGARPRRVLLFGVESLTPSERRVARLAADGLTNRQIAQELFLSKKTVEMHLAAAFRKLDVASRHDLPAALQAGGT